ncbi:MAG: universal stress protein, partial [Gammaproteobacteria bacterium]
MEAYRNILIALDFAPGADAVLERARDLSERHGARLVLLHVVEYVPPLDLAYDPVVPMGVDIENQLVERAQAELEGRV